MDSPVRPVGVASGEALSWNGGAGPRVGGGVDHSTCGEKSEEDGCELHVFIAR